ncbi:MAG: Ig-like domain-containing protein [Candidatus Zixiibacteriota bacterium]|nr:MAG: Ig-like domain-containing protein [candidate division Zixibacteria bacterium]
MIRKGPVLLMLIGLMTAGALAFAQDAERALIDSMPPVVIETIPIAGDLTVDPNTTEICVSFSKDMRTDIWSWVQVNDNTFPDITGEIKYLDDNRTCILPVKLKPGKAYAIWLNSDKNLNFKDVRGKPAVPYLLAFKTKKMVSSQ